MASDNGQSDVPASHVDEDKGSNSATPTSPPPPPIPSADPKLVFQARTPPPLHTAPSPSSHDLFKLSPIAALKLLGASVEALVHITGDIPPTPPPTSPTIPNMRSMQREKAEIVRNLSEKSLVRLREQAEIQARAQAQTQNPAQATPNQSIDGVHLKKASTPGVPKSTPEPYIIIGANSQPLNLQHSAITRKFFSKQPPPISIEDYLLRIHRFCPMSTAVYLATSFYIFRLAVVERAIVVTRRNCHRLLLAGLRVAMKALEDLSYPHAKVARVGGVSEIELARLEISFCFLTSFELVIGEDTLKSHWETLKHGHGLVGFELAQSDDDAIPILKLDETPKKG
ncbi:cyclin-domain-containing protein [Daldinia vernicosa]|uniref:cyclin-domain-containing protein n=1 Tax=Daldinia vernicosa TaxID=114800 RepID=UPI002007CF45|nr:cyclin-domain-containing protein [Daldinia vernicosa]KAI0846338.1 cyclin-domain-containing protein [Daldinia vernicosa]